VATAAPECGQTGFARRRRPIGRRAVAGKQRAGGTPNGPVRNSKTTSARDVPQTHSHPTTHPQIPVADAEFSR